MKVVLDANVLVAANRRATHASFQCAAACARVLLKVQKSDVLLEDTGDLVFREYKTYCSFSGQPGPGDRFFAWYMQNRWTSSVERIDIGDDIKSAIPVTLHAMDESDHKWIAVYFQGNADVIYNATDSDWEEHADAFESHGVTVNELCSASPDD